MAAIWYDHGAPSFLGVPPSFAFHELPEIHVEAPTPYAAARFEMMAREHRLGAAYYRHNAELAHAFYMRKRSWWLL